MGTSTTVGGFAGKIQAGGMAVQSAEWSAVNEAALAGKGIFLANMGTRTIRNLGAGAKVGARYDMGGTPSAPTALLRYTGPVHILNNDIRPHAIYPRGARVRAEDGAIARGLPNASSPRGRSFGARRGGAMGLTIGPNVRLYANHPGTTGKQFYERSVPQVKAVAAKIMRTRIGSALRSVF